MVSQGSLEPTNEEEKIQALFTVGFAQSADATQKWTVEVLQIHVVWLQRKSVTAKSPSEQNFKLETDRT